MHASSGGLTKGGDNFREILKNFKNLNFFILKLKAIFGLNPLSCLLQNVFSSHKFRKY